MTAAAERDVDWDERDGLLTFAALIRIVVAVVLGVLLGLAVTINSLDLDRLGVRVGPWRSTPRDSLGDSDPYALAADARAGLLPLGAAEGVSFTASADSSGGALDARCDYRVKGPMPAARYWTLSLLDPSGYPVADAADRYGFTSSEVLRFDGAPVVIAVSASARSGNWLPIGRAGNFTLMLRLYDTNLSTERTGLDKIALPAIERTGCR